MFVCLCWIIFNITCLVLGRCIVNLLPIYVSITSSIVALKPQHGVAMQSMFDIVIIPANEGEFQFGMCLTGEELPM